MGLGKVGSILKGIRKVLTLVTNVKDVLPLPKGVKDVLQKGRDAGLWQEKHGFQGVRLIAHELKGPEPLRVRLDYALGTAFVVFDNWISTRPTFWVLVVVGVALAFLASYVFA